MTKTIQKETQKNLTWAALTELVPLLYRAMELRRAMLDAILIPLSATDGQFRNVSPYFTGSPGLDDVYFRFRPLGVRGRVVRVPIYRSEDETLRLISRLGPDGGGTFSVSISYETIPSGWNPREVPKQ